MLDAAASEMLLLSQKKKDQKQSQNQSQNRAFKGTYFGGEKMLSGKQELNSITFLTETHEDAEIIKKYMPNNVLPVERIHKTDGIIITVLKTEYPESNAHITIPEIYSSVKMWNEGDPHSLIWALNDAFEKSVKKGNVAEYLEDDFFCQLNESRNTEPISTGIKSLDGELGGGLYPGLFGIGGLPGVGKSAFILQIADHVASQGNPVLYISLEMPRFELICRSLARVMFEGGQRAYNTGHILNGKIESFVLKEYVDQYSPTAENIYILDGSFQIKAESIRSEAVKIRRKTGKNPVIIVDYLQALKPSEESRGKDKRLQTDDDVQALKRISEDLKTTVFFLSSYNRQSHDKAKPTMANFRESSGVEFTADCLIALCSQDQEVNQYEETRDLQAHILKNRRGRSGKEINLIYYPAYNSVEDDRANNIKMLQ